MAFFAAHGVVGFEEFGIQYAVGSIHQLINPQDTCPQVDGHLRPNCVPINPAPPSYTFDYSISPFDQIAYNQPAPMVGIPTVGTTPPPSTSIPYTWGSNSFGYAPIGYTFNTDYFNKSLSKLLAQCTNEAVAFASGVVAAAGTVLTSTKLPQAISLIRTFLATARAAMTVEGVSAFVIELGTLIGAGPLLLALGAVGGLYALFLALQKCAAAESGGV